MLFGLYPTCYLAIGDVALRSWQTALNINPTEDGIPTFKWQCELQMSYQYDLFISYVRDPETEAWIERHLIRLLRWSLRQERPSEPTVFYDTRIRVGDEWTVELGNAIGRSRLLLALLSRAYFSSRWCVLELALMMDRQRTTRANAGSRNLILPFIVHDCEDLGNYGSLAGIQALRLHPWFNPRMNTYGALAQGFSNKMREQSAAISRAIDAAPAWQEEWCHRSESEFVQELLRPQPIASRLPRF